MSWPLVVLLALAAAVGFALLYSAAEGDLRPWALSHAIRFALGLGLMVTIAMIDIRRFHRFAYVIYGVAALLLVAVAVAGVGKGAQRWLEIPLPGLGFQLQPSETMKLALVLALARYFHGLAPGDAGRWTAFVVPLALIALPAALVMRQPDLGTAFMILAGGIAMMFLAGVSLRWLAGGFAVVLASIPVLWLAVLHDYQKDRLRTFLRPGDDPLGAGWNIIQSKIALGSGGLLGKGYLEGTQVHLDFVPERHTDFIFTLLAEEFGLMGALALIALYLLVMAYGFAVAIRSGSQFGRLLAMGVTVAFGLYVFVNIAMVTGTIPVVGVPLPLVSYGGTAMLTLMAGFGLVASAHIHRDIVPPRQPGGLL